MKATEQKLTRSLSDYAELVSSPDTDTVDPICKVVEASAQQLEGGTATVIKMEDPAYATVTSVF